MERRLIQTRTRGLWLLKLNDVTINIHVIPTFGIYYTKYIDLERKYYFLRAYESHILRIKIHICEMRGLNSRVLRSFTYEFIAFTRYPPGGQTKRYLKTRINEHIKNIKAKESKLSVVSKHMLECNLTILSIGKMLKSYISNKIIIKELYLRWYTLKHKKTV